MWHLWPQQQQRGAQFRRTGPPPPEAVDGREAQEHDRADQDVGGPGAVRQPVYPAGRMQDEKSDGAPPPPRPEAERDRVVRPERVAPIASGTDPDDLPLPEGK